MQNIAYICEKLHKFPFLKFNNFNLFNKYLIYCKITKEMVDYFYIFFKDFIVVERNRIGEKVRLIRESRNLTLEDVSERTNISTFSIRSIERGMLIPGLTPLIKIARVLGVRLGTFMDDQENIGPTVSRASELSDSEGVTRFSERKNAMSSDLDFHSLAQNKADRHMDPFIIDIFPPSQEEVKLSSHEGEEFIYVLSGTVEIFYGKDKYRLTEGDSIYYDSIVAHHVHSYEGNAKILAVVYTPI